jgi:hypothetical protein
MKFRHEQAELDLCFLTEEKLLNKAQRAKADTPLIGLF